jgi:hypothetical protein
MFVEKRFRRIVNFLDVPIFVLDDFFVATLASAALSTEPGSLGNLN